MSPGLRGRVTPAWILVAVLLVAGLVVRVILLSSGLRYIDADEAITGLMGRHFLDGDFTGFYWGQAYGGVHEQALVAFLLALRFPRFLAVKLVPLALFALAAVLVWRIARRVAGRMAGLFAGALFWAYPVGIVWMSTKGRGYYGAALVLGLATLFFALRLADGWGRGDAIGLGLCAGSAWYATPQSGYFLFPVAAWLLVHALRSGGLPRVLRLAPYVGGALIVGAAPWIVVNLRNGFDSLNPPDQPETTAAFRFGLFFRRGLPVATGFVHPFLPQWMGGAAGIGIYVATLAATVVAVALTWWRQRPRWLVPVLLIAVMYPLAFAALPTSWFLNDPRYVTFFVPVAAILAGWLFARAPVAVQVAAVAGVLVVSWWGMDQTLTFSRSGPPRWDVAAGDIGPLVEVLREEDVDRMYADYWIANRVTFETDEAVVAAPLQVIRHRPYERMVRAEEMPPYALFLGTPYEVGMRVYLQESGVPFRERRVGQWVVFFPERRVAPEDVIPDWYAARVSSGFVREEAAART